MPSDTAVRKWVLEDVDGFSSRYARAREMQIERWADELLDISDDGTNDYMERNRRDGDTEIVLNNEHVQRSRLRADSRKWLLSKLKPERYGDRTVHQHGGDPENPIKAVTRVEVRLIKPGEGES
jgi:hypothetical protein